MGRSMLGALASWVACAAWSLALGSCARPERPELPGDPLVLELGGDSPTLGEILRNVKPRPAAAGAGASAAPAPGVATPPPRTAPEPATPTPTPAPLPVAATREVRLEQGQTLYDLCVDLLGDGGRWREVMELNGWRESQLRRLPIGTRVRMPVR